MTTDWRPGDLLATTGDLATTLATGAQASSHSIHWRPAGDLLATWRPGDLATWPPLATYWQPTGDFYWRPGDPGLKKAVAQVAAARVAVATAAVRAAVMNEGKAA